MSCIQGLLGALTHEVENRLKPALTGLGGFLVKGNLPQVWVFETEVETTSFVVDSEGNATVESGARFGRDVTIKWQHDFLASVLGTRSRASIPGGVRPTVTFQTQKGRRAFNFLRGQLGL